MMTYQAVLDSVRQLPYDEQRKLADELIETLDPPLSLSPDWDEIRRRMEETKSGADVGVDGEEVLARLRQKYK